MRSRAAAIIVVLFANAAVGAAQQVAAPTGTAVLSGTLMTDETTSRPVRRATVRLGGAAGTSARLAGTDDQGRFIFPDLPAGSYTLSATKPGYVAAFHGSTRPGRGPGVPVAVGNAQRVEATLRMLPGAVITGAITDARGTPVPAVPVTAVEVRPAGAVATPPARATTDDRGVYRIFGLAPGDYVVSAVPRLGGPGRSAITTDIVAVTDAEVRWARSLGTSPAPASVPPATGRPVTYTPVFYPGTANVAAATTITIAAGEERANVGFSLQIVPTARIAGTILDQTGQPISPVSVFLYPKRTPQPSASDALIASGALTLPRALMNGSEFSIPGVTPGDYTLVARTGSSGRGAAAPTAVQTLWSVTDLTIAGEDQTGMVLRLQAGVSVSGSIAFERSSGAPAPDVSRLELSMVAVNPLVGTTGVSRGVVEPNGTFRFTSLVPGAYALNTTPPVAWAPATWTVKSAMLNGRDVADVLLDAKLGQDVAGLVITFSDRAASFAGKLVDAGGRPVTRYLVVVFTADQKLWLPNARRIRSTTPATDGTFSVTGLPAGEYAIAAAENIEPADLADPAVLSQLLASAYKVTLAEGERKTQDLRVGR